MSKKRFNNGEFKMVSAKLTEDELFQLKRNAHKQGLNVSEYIRTLSVKITA